MASDTKPRPQLALENRVATLEAQLAALIAGTVTLGALTITGNINIAGDANFQGDVAMGSLASSDPHAAGALYVSTDTLKVSAG